MKSETEKRRKKTYITIYKKGIRLIEEKENTVYIWS